MRKRNHRAWARRERWANRFFKELDKLRIGEAAKRLRKEIKERGEWVTQTHAFVEFTVRHSDELAGPNPELDEPLYG